MRKPHPALYALSIKEIAAMCGVSSKTASRWKSGHFAPSKSDLIVLEGDLGGFDPAWRGWTLRSGKLISPEGFEETPGSVRAIQFMQAQIATYQTLNRQLREQVNSMLFEEQPTPDSWEIEIKTG